MTQTDIFAENRAVLAQLMWNLENFTMKELLESYHKELGENRTQYLGDGQRIRDYIEEMCDFGILDEYFGIYTYIRKVKHKSAS